jgi:F0F1-type ATP synthase assembly protein I
MRLRMNHICAALAAAIALFLAFIAMGIAVMSGLAALLAAALVAWIVYRMARNALTRDRVSRVAAEGAPRAVPPPAT